MSVAITFDGQIFEDFFYWFAKTAICNVQRIGVQRQSTDLGHTHILSRLQLNGCTQLKDVTSFLQQLWVRVSFGMTNRKELNIFNESYTIHKSQLNKNYLISQ